MKDLYFDYAGTLPEEHPGRRLIERMETGDLLHLHLADDKVLLMREGQIVGRLSKTAAAHWRDRLHLITEARVAAMVRRSLADLEGDPFRSRCRGEYWEFPLVELRVRDR
jgi:hypothetical protein